MEGWLDFMAKLARAQHRVATTLPPGAAPDEAMVEQAVDARMPPLAADGHRRDPAWRDGLALLLDTRRRGAAVSGGARSWRNCAPAAPNSTEALADAFLRGAIDETDAGRASGSPRRCRSISPALRRASRRRRCACSRSGALPLLRLDAVCGRGDGAGQNPGARYLYCSLCSTAWNYARAVCITCGGSRTLAIRGIEGDSGVVKAETCDECRTYAKMVYQAKDMQVDPYADDLATLGLDIMVAEAGWSRHAPNPLLLVG